MMETSKIKEGGVGLNYAAWSIKIKVFMQAYGVWEAVEQTNPKMKVEERKRWPPFIKRYQKKCFY